MASGREARRPRDDRGQVVLDACDDDARHDRRRRLRDRAGLEERGLPRVRRRRAARRCTSAARTPVDARGASAPSSPRGSARTSRSSARSGIERGRRRDARRRTCTRRRTRSACSSTTKGGSPELPRAARDAHRVRAADVPHARRGAGRARRRRARDPREAADEVRVEAGGRPREDRRGHAEQALLRASRCSTSRRGSTTRA